MNTLDRLTDYSVDMDAENIMDVRTEKLDPIVSSAYRYTFRLDTSAYLDKNTMLLFKCKAKTGEGANNCRLNCWNGGLGAIQNVELRIGDFSVQRINNVNLWSTMNHLYSSTPEVQNKKFSHYLQNGLKYQVRNSQGAADEAMVGTIQPDNDNSGINYGRADTRAGAAVNSHKIEEDESNNQLVGIPLGMLLPILNTRDLPLFLFTSYKVHITIEFNPNSSEFGNKIGAPSANLACADGDILFSDVNLLADYLIFPSRVQESVRQQTSQQGGYVMDYINVETIQKTISAGTANVEQQIEQRINVVNQEVHYLQAIRQFTTYDDNNNRVLLGQRCDGVSMEEIQYNINGVDYFNAGFVFNPVELYNQCTYTLGRDLQVVSPYYINDVNHEASMLSPPSNGILGKYKPLMLDLRNGEPSIRGGGRMIGNYPIRIIYRRTPHAAVACDAGLGGFNIAQADTSGQDLNIFVGVTRVVKVLSLPSGGMNVTVSDI